MKFFKRIQGNHSGEISIRIAHEDIFIALLKAHGFESMASEFLKNSIVQGYEVNGIFASMAMRAGRKDEHDMRLFTDAS